VDENPYASATRTNDLHSRTSTLHQSPGDHFFLLNLRWDRKGGS